MSDHFSFSTHPSMPGLQSVSHTSPSHHSSSSGHAYGSDSVDFSTILAPNPFTNYVDGSGDLTTLEGYSLDLATDGEARELLKCDDGTWGISCSNCLVRCRACSHTSRDAFIRHLRHRRVDILVAELLSGRPLAIERFYANCRLALIIFDAMRRKAEFAVQRGYERGISSITSPFTLFNLRLAVCFTGAPHFLIAWIDRHFGRITNDTHFSRVYVSPRRTVDEPSLYPDEIDNISPVGPGWNRKISGSMPVTEIEDAWYLVRTHVSLSPQTLIYNRPRLSCTWLWCLFQAALKYKMAFKFYTPYSPLLLHYPSLLANMAPAPKRPSPELLNDILSFPTTRFDTSLADAKDGALDTAASRTKMFFHTLQEHRASDFANVSDGTFRQIERANDVYTEIVRSADKIESTGGTLDKDCKSAVSHAKLFRVWFKSLDSLRQPVDAPTEPAALREKAKATKAPRKKEIKSKAVIDEIDEFLASDAEGEDDQMEIDSKPVDIPARRPVGGHTVSKSLDTALPTADRYQRQGSQGTDLLHQGSLHQRGQGTGRNLGRDNAVEGQPNYLSVGAKRQRIDPSDSGGLSSGHTILIAHRTGLYKLRRDITEDELRDERDFVDECIGEWEAAREELTKRINALKASASRGSKSSA
ncbi:hypothetical protein FB45DRAFT_869371 [Roridomyces roridus]|uniref:Uncharacterized protein n=1 Tax=Roridomyces roridus TaxID=1738132 RepID=A0AAD7FHH8_9AGAR|nr:hypothetical protein FB45DRAFT_869371 [Roridomyces roridus]